MATNLERCLESLGYCHQQEASLWPAARSVARQDIDAFLREAGPQLAARREALDLLMREFSHRFPDHNDPVFIRGYMRQIERELRREAERTTGPDVPSESEVSPSTRTPADDPAEPSTTPMTDAQRQDIARLSHQANVPDRSEEQLSAEDAQQLINELRQKAADLGHS